MRRLSELRFSRFEGDGVHERPSPVEPFSRTSDPRTARSEDTARFGKCPIIRSTILGTQVQIARLPDRSEMSVRHALLALLAGEPRFGLQLKHDFEVRTGEVWPLNAGQVYSTLQRLARDELVTTDGIESDAGKRMYRITPTGRDELDSWFQSAPSDIPPRDELVIRVLVALAVPDVDVSEIIQAHRRRLVETMQAFTRLKADASDLALLLVADAELFRLDAAVRWLDAAQARITNGARTWPATARPEPGPAATQETATSGRR